MVSRRVRLVAQRILDRNALFKAFQGVFVVDRAKVHIDLAQQILAVGHQLISRVTGKQRPRIESQMHTLLHESAEAGVLHDFVAGQDQRPRGGAVRAAEQICRKRPFPPVRFHQLGDDAVQEPENRGSLFLLLTGKHLQHPGDFRTENRGNKGESRRISLVKGDARLLDVLLLKRQAVLLVQLFEELGGIAKHPLSELLR